MASASIGAQRLDLERIDGVEGIVARRLGLDRRLESEIRLLALTALAARASETSAPWSRTRAASGLARVARDLAERVGRIPFAETLERSLDARDALAVASCTCECRR
jgi:hypothetical protein